MKRFSFYILSVCLLLLTSCYRDFQYDREGLSPHIVLHGFVRADTLMDVRVSKSWLIGDEPSDSLFDEARLTLFVNGKQKCLDTTIPRSGDRLRMVVEADGLPSVEASTEVPERIRIEQVDYTKTEERYETVFNTKIRFRDPSDERNYYGIGVCTTDSFIFQIAMDKTQEPLLDELAIGSILDDLLFTPNRFYSRTYIFSDEQIEGKEYTLDIPIHIMVSPSTPISAYKALSFSVCLYSISESYYKYLLSLMRQGINRISEYGIADPNRTYKNVENGIGVLAAYQVDTFTIRWQFDSLDN